MAVWGYDWCQLLQVQRAELAHLCRWRLRVPDSGIRQFGTICMCVIEQGAADGNVLYLLCHRQHHEPEMLMENGGTPVVFIVHATQL